MNPRSLLAAAAVLWGCGRPSDSCGASLTICSIGCEQETSATTCVNGVWQCPPGLEPETPQTCPAHAHLCDGLSAALPLACSCDPATGALGCDGGSDGSACPAVPELRLSNGTLFTCVAAACGNDAGARPICANGGLACPSGYLEAPAVCSRPDAEAGRDAGGATDAGSAEDAGARACPAYGQDGGPGALGGCTYNCGSDTGVNPVCSDGAWRCPPGAFSVESCPPGGPGGSSGRGA